MQFISFLSHQVALSESNFETPASIDCISRPVEINNQPLTHRRFPLRSIEEMTLPDNLSEEERRLLHILQLEED